MSKRKSDAAAGVAARSAKAPSTTPGKQAEKPEAAAGGEQTAKRTTRKSLNAAAEAVMEKENLKATAAGVEKKEKKRKSTEAGHAEGYKRATTKPVVAQATLQAVAEATKEAKKALSKPMSRPTAPAAADSDAAHARSDGRDDAAPPAKRGRRESAVQNAPELRPSSAAQRSPSAGARGDAGAGAGPSSAAHADETPGRGAARGKRAGEHAAPLPQNTVQKAAGIEASIRRAADAAAKAAEPRAPADPFAVLTEDQGRLLAAFKKLQGAHQGLLEKYRASKKLRIEHMERLVADHRQLLKQHSESHSVLVNTLRDELTREQAKNERLLAERGDFPAKAAALESSLIDLQAEMNAAKTAELAARREAAELRGTLEKAQLELRRAEERAAQLAAAVADAEGRAAAAQAQEPEPEPVSAEGLVRIAGAQAFASEAFETITGLRWARAGPGVHRFTHKASGFVFQISNTETQEDGGADDGLFNLQCKALFVPETARRDLAASAGQVGECLLGAGLEFQQRDLPKVIGAVMMSLQTAA